MQYPSTTWPGVCDVLGVGADFLGGWVSPVEYARQYGEFRQGREGVRGTLVQAESRMSLTAASADKWLPLWPGSEAQFLLAVAKLVLEEKPAEDALKKAADGADLTVLVKACGIEEKRLRKVAHELVKSEKPLVICGASAVHTNSLDALVIGNMLNVLLGGAVTQPKKPRAMLDHGDVIRAIKQARVVLLDGDNPVYNLPAASGVREALAGRELIVSFGNFIDDTSAYADLLLPDHHSLEAMLDVRPLYNTRSLKEILSAIAPTSTTSQNPVAISGHCRAAILGCEAAFQPPPGVSTAVSSQTHAQFDGGEAFPYLFQPYLSLQFYDGRGANLPWLQELPDPTSSAMWELPVEIDPQTATKLNVVNGDRLRVESAHGNLEAWAYVNPAAIPGVVSMAIGQGHNTIRPLRFRAGSQSAGHSCAGV